MWKQPEQLEAVFAQIGQRWGRLDFVLHAIAFAPAADLHGRVVDSSAAGFARAMDMSCHSFIRMARLAEPLMKDGGALVTMSYYGAQKVIPNYGIMGPVKAALEATVRYLAAELGPGGIRVHAVSPGPIKTRAASGIGEFEKLLDDAAHPGARAPARHDRRRRRRHRHAVQRRRPCDDGQRGLRRRRLPRDGLKHGHRMSPP